MQRTTADRRTALANLEARLRAIPKPYRNRKTRALVAFLKRSICCTKSAIRRASCNAA